MSAVVFEEWLQPITQGDPCGADLEYDAAFLELETRARATSGDGVVDAQQDAQGPDWKLISRQAQGLLSRTKDVRVALFALKAALRLHGILGLRDAVAALRALLERYWRELHPRIDADPEGNTLLRLNTLRELCDPSDLLGPLREAALVSLPGLGSFSLRDVGIATGEVVSTQPGAAPIDMATIDAAFGRCDADQLRATDEALQQTAADLTAIASFVTTQLKGEHVLNFEPTTDLIRKMRTELTTRSAQRTDGALAAPVGSAQPGAFGAMPQQAPGAVASRADVVRTLERLCDYYDKNEPSSPVPMLLRRAQRLATMGFFDIVRELAPSGMPEVEMIRGPQESEP